ncbi:uncharacterized protein LOC144424633 [Styela clava]
MAAVQCFLLVLFAGALRPTFCQCDNTSLVINEGNGEITSPNYPPNEYGESASCSWEFQPPVDGKNYSLGLTIIYQRLYFVVEGGSSRKNCSGNYSLLINNDKQDCQRYIGFVKQYVTLMFYDSDSCGAGSPKQSFSPSVNVRYTSEGSLWNDPQTTMGFKIQYKFTECIEATTLQPTTIVPTTTVVQTTTWEESTTYMLETTASEKQETSSLKSITSTKTEKYVMGSTEGQRESTEGQLSTTTVLILVSIPGFIGIIILIASAIIYCRGRNKSSAKPFFNKEEIDMKKLRNEEDKPGRESGEGDKLQTNTTAQSTEADTSALYSTIVKHTGAGAKEPIEI